MKWIQGTGSYDKDIDLKNGHTLLAYVRPVDGKFQVYIFRGGYDIEAQGIYDTLTEAKAVAEALAAMRRK